MDKGTGRVRVDSGGQAGWKMKYGEGSRTLYVNFSVVFFRPYSSIPGYTEYREQTFVSYFKFTGDFFFLLGITQKTG